MLNDILLDEIGKRVTMAGSRLIKAEASTRLCTFHFFFSYSMTILFSCPQCAKTANLPEHFVGKTVKCKCGHHVVVEAAPSPVLELDNIQYEAVDETAPLARGKGGTNPIGRAKSHKLKKENKVLSKKLGKNWRVKADSEYRAGSDRKRPSWVNNIKDVITQGTIQAFWSFAFGVLLLCFGIHMLSWGGAEIGISETAGNVSRLLVQCSFFLMIFGGFVAFCSFSLLCRAFFSGDIRQQFEPKTATSLIGGTCLLVFVLVDFTTWIILRNVGLGATSVENYGASLAQGETNLLTRGEAPQAWESDTTPEDPNVSLITYPSGDFQLKARLWMPKKVKDKHPVLIYLHPGHALEELALKDVEHFHKNDYIVMCPSFRGENGNAGYYELMFGEVDDAVAATRWIAQQENVDANQIHVFGYGVGGGIAALMALRDDAQVQTTASCGGLYQDSAFQKWPNNVPFNVHNRWERRSRVLLGRINEMKLKHIAYIGNSDAAFKDSTSAAKKEVSMLQNPRLVIRPVNGDHASSLRNAVREFETYIHKRL